MIVPLTASDDPQALQTLDLAHRLFSPATLEPDALLKDEIDSVCPGDVRYFVWEEDGVRAFCRVAFLSVGKFLVHLGVDDVFQGKGLGGRLLEHVLQIQPELPVFLEVEEGKARRWWSAKGARVVAPGYAQPALRPGYDPISMALMAIGEVGRIEDAIRAIYEEFYRLGEDDPLLRHVLQEGKA